MYFAVVTGNRRPVHDENPNSRHEILGDVIPSVLHFLLHSLQRLVGIIPQRCGQ
jgi:hypothetical protein